MAVTSVQSGLATLAVTDRGSGAALVFLHAGVADKRSWGEVIEALAVLKPIRSVAYDRRGFGASTWLPEPHSHVGDLIAVLDACSIESAMLVGCSQGAKVALDASLAYPERISGLVLISPAVSGAPKPPDSMFATWSRLLMDEIEMAEMSDDLDSVNELEARLWLDGSVGWDNRVQGTPRDLFLDMNGIALRADDVGECVDDTLNAWKRLRKLEARANALPPVKVPSHRISTKIVSGDLDLPHVSNRAELLHKMMAPSEYFNIDRCAHLVEMQAPSQVARIIASNL